jgi:hypothetical protein
MDRQEHSTKKRTKQAIITHRLQQTNAQPTKSRRTYHLQSSSQDTVDAAYHNAAYHNAAYHNATESPLLLLPAELRERIWELAFGNRTIHPYIVQPDPKQAKLLTIVFEPCNEPFMDHEVYAYRLDDQSAMKDPRWKEACRRARALRTYVGSHENCPDVIEDPTQPLYMDNISFIVPLVCTQVYYEAMHIAWKTSVFQFNDSGRFLSFFNAPNVRTDLIRRLSLDIGPTRQEYDNWHRALQSEVYTGRLKAIRGLDLFCSYLDRYWPVYFTSANFLEKTRIKDTVAALRWIPLERHLLTVFVCHTYD